jgi:hypothetical protein
MFIANHLCDDISYSKKKSEKKEEEGPEEIDPEGAHLNKVKR